MSRIATWKRRPEDPRTPLGWIVWGDRHLPAPKRRRLAQATGAFLLALVGLGALGWWAALFLAVPVGWLALALYARPGAREHADLPALGGADAFPVTVDLRHRGRQVGRENGWVAFVDGWLVYEGLRTSFALRPRDVRPVAHLRGEVLLELRDGMGSLRMSLLTDPMQTSRPARGRDRRRLVEDYERWTRQDSPEGESVLPPCEISPRVAGERIGERFAALVVTLLMGLFAALYGGSPWLVGAAALASPLLLLSIALRFGRLRRDLRRDALPPASQKEALP